MAKFKPKNFSEFFTRQSAAAARQIVPAPLHRPKPGFVDQPRAYPPLTAELQDVAEQRDFHKFLDAFMGGTRTTKPTVEGEKVGNFQVFREPLACSELTVREIEAKLAEPMVYPRPAELKITSRETAAQHREWLDLQLAEIMVKNAAQRRGEDLSGGDIKTRALTMLAAL